MGKQILVRPTLRASDPPVAGGGSGAFGAKCGYNESVESCQSRRALDAPVSPLIRYTEEMILDCFHWSNCPAQTQIQVNQLVMGFRHQLDEALTGIYLHGSLATGCFNPARSDIDLLAITRQRLSIGAKKQLLETLLRISNSPHPVEISFLCFDDLHPWQYPTPFDLHYSEDWREQYEQDLASDRWQDWSKNATDKDLAAHIAMTKIRGICLWGEAVNLVFPDVPREDFADSIASDLEWALERLNTDPVYGVLNACRIYAYFRNALVLSKTEGAEWALEEMPRQFRSVIVRSLEIYRSSERRVALPNVKEVQQLLTYVASVIKAAG